MNKTYLGIGISAFLIAVVGVFGVDYFSHLLFSNPMETGPYFLAKLALYFLFSIVFLAIFKLQDNAFGTVAGAGVVVAALWGIYYNILPMVFDFYPYGIALKGLNFLGMGLLGTGIAFGVVHTVAFVAGYYVAIYTAKIMK